MERGVKASCVHAEVVIHCECVGSSCEVEAVPHWGRGREPALP